MKTAFSTWEHRIAPVLDTARHLHVVTSARGKIEKEQRHVVTGDHPSQFIVWLTAQGVETLVCGAVSRFFQEQLSAAGINVIPFITGELTHVIQAYFEGTLEQTSFRMPGCCGRRQRSFDGRHCQGRGQTL
jgi:predicted Fe-Mo cluster-binding NifX family protein